jgi:arginyl-tRNA synthetase
VADLNGKHFRSALLGAQLAALYQEQGWDVIQINYLGDWGKPIGLLGAGYERFGSEELLKSDALPHLRDVHRRMTELLAPELAASKKARDSVIADDSLPAPTLDTSKDIHAERDMFSSKLEAGDEKMLLLWKTLQEESINAYRQIYARLGINFDHYTGESQVGEATMTDVVERLKAKGFCEDEGGWLVVHLQNHGSRHGTAKLRDPTGGSTYLLRDIGAAIERNGEHAFDKMLYVVANDQHATHFQRMFKILEMLDMTDLAGKLQHVAFNESSHIPKPSSADESLDLILNRFEDLFQASAADSARPLFQKGGAMSNLAISACYAQVSNVKRTSELKFDMPMLASLDTPGPLSALEWLVRMTSIPLVRTEDGHDDKEHYLDDYENAVLLRWLAHYPDVIQGTLRTLEPATILHYTGSPAAQVDDSFEGDDIVASSQEHAVFLNAVKIVLSNALKTLKITRYDREH